MRLPSGKVCPLGTPRARPMSPRPSDVFGLYAPAAPGPGPGFGGVVRAARIFCPSSSRSAGVTGPNRESVTGLMSGGSVGAWASTEIAGTAAAVRMSRRIRIGSSSRSEFVVRGRNALGAQIHLGRRAMVRVVVEDEHQQLETGHRSFSARVGLRQLRRRERGHG